MIELVSLEQHGWLKGVVGSLLVLNMLDGVLTIAWVNLGRATEMNPLMDVLLSTHPVLFMAIKLLLVCLGVLLLWRYRTKTTAIVSIYLCFVAYAGVLLYHLGGGVIS
jgi:hypothetical protein